MVSTAGGDYSLMSHRFILLAFTFALAAWPARAQVEEEETAPKKPLKKIEIPDDPPPKITPGTPNVVPDLGRAAETAFEHPTLKAFFVKLAVAHDRVTLTTNRAQRIAPVPLVFGKDKFPNEFGVQPLDDRNQPGEDVTLVPSQVRSILPYEQIALNEVETLLKLPTNPAAPSMKDRLLAAERLLAQVLFFHEDAVEKERRMGKSWERYKVALNDKLLEVRLGLGKETAAAKDWPALKEMIQRYSERYRTQPKVLQEFAALRLSEAEELVKQEKVADWESALAILRNYESQYPNTATEAVKRLRAAFGAKAKELLDSAQKQAAGNQAEARNILRTIETIAPDQPGLQELRNQLRSGTGTLIVGTRRMPELMSPALARYDSEKQVAELLFEGFYEAVPDEALGTVYRPALGAHKPRVIPGGREIDLVPNAEWANPGRTPFAMADALATMQLHRERREDVSSFADLFEETQPENNALRIRFKQAHPDPRELLTFKILPGQWMNSQKVALEDEAFARNPFGTGPYRLPAGYRPPMSGIAPVDFSLTANPAYGKRHPGQPGIRDIKFLDVTKLTDPVNEVRGGRLHLLTDVPTADVAKYESLPNAVVATAENNRRVHFLAINHRNAALQNADVRKGIQAAIDREAILNEVFRAGTKHHKALTGPFPPDSWAVPKGDASPLFQPTVASVKLKAVADKPLTLIYPDDDPLAKVACERIAKQVTDAGLPLQVEAVPPRSFVQRLELEHRYDLAYVAYDYPDDWYPLDLARLLDGSAANRGGRNFLGYLAPKTNSTLADRKFATLLTGVRDSRDFEGALKPKAQEIHAKFAEVVPFVPLWQLDRHTVVSKFLKLPLPAKLLNPTTLFSGVKDWKLEEGK